VVLLAANALFLFFALVDLFVIFEDWSNNFVNRIDASAFGQFVGLVPVLFPLLAVLIATHLRPAVPQARLITVAALVEYGVSAVFGAICMLVGFLHGLTLTGSVSGMSQPRAALETILVRGAWMVLLLFAAYAVYLLFQGLYAAPKPPPYPAGYPAPYPQYAYPQPQQGPPAEETKITSPEPPSQPGS
jgi:hypothetical protein